MNKYKNEIALFTMILIYLTGALGFFIATYDFFYFDDLCCMFSRVGYKIFFTTYTVLVVGFAAWCVFYYKPSPLSLVKAVGKFAALFAILFGLFFTSYIAFGKTFTFVATGTIVVAFFWHLISKRMKKEEKEMKKNRPPKTPEEMLEEYNKAPEKYNKT